MTRSFIAAQLTSKGRNFKCSKCGFCFHRDGVGAINIRSKYQGNFGSLVVGDMAPPIGMRFRPHTSVARWEKAYQREAVGL